jgi:Phospholipase_D-nuclease N-terminal
VTPVNVLLLVYLAALVALAVDMILRYRRRDLSGGMFAVWVVAVILLPFLGVTAYAVLRLVPLARRA